MDTIGENQIYKVHRPFNTYLECGLRLLFVLNAVSPRLCDVQRLVYYDYLLVHSADFNGPPSLHANVPLRDSQWLTRRKLVTEAMDLMCSRELADKKFSNQGVTYTSNDLTGAFLGYFESSYAKRTIEVSFWLAKSFQELSEQELNDLLSQKIGKWQAEFYVDSQSLGDLA